MSGWKSRALTHERPDTARRSKENAELLRPGPAGGYSIRLLSRTGRQCVPADSNHSRIANSCNCWNDPRCRRIESWTFRIGTLSDSDDLGEPLAAEPFRTGGVNGSRLTYDEQFVVRDRPNVEIHPADRRGLRLVESLIEFLPFATRTDVSCQ